jgi:hypothetical protein
MNWVYLGLGILTIFLIAATVQPIVSFDDNDCCSICGSYWAEEKLLDGEDPGDDCCGGLHSALDQVWYRCNFGKHKGDLEWLESIRLKYGYTNMYSFLSINYSNSCPFSPNLKYLGTGYIVDYTPWSYDGPAYSITKIHYNNSNHTFNNCGWHPYPFNHSCTTHVFRERGGAWWNRFKEVELYDSSDYPFKPEQVNISWVEYQIDYDEYLLNGGIDIGDGY